MKKNIFDKLQDLLASKIEKFEKREDKDVLKKLLFWMVFFFPYGIYLLLFKTKINKFFKVLITITMLFAVIIGLDVALYPNRVYNSASKEAYTQFVLENKDLKLREPLYASKTADFQMNGELYFAFNIYDSLDMYYGIFKIKNYHKNYELVSLYTIDYDFANIYAIEEFKKIKDIHPVVLSFILSAKKDFNINNISTATDVKEDDVFHNIINQELTIEDKIYSFEFNDFTVTKIIEKSENKIVFEDASQNIFDTFTPQIVRGILEKNFRTNYKVLGYNYYNNAHYYNIEVADAYYTVKYLPGKNADLLLIDNLDDFKKQFINLVRK